MKITYGQLDRALRSLGFSVRVVEEDKAVHYGHLPSGALVSLPKFPPGKEVMAHHLSSTRVVLDDFGIADPSVFDEKLRQAG